MRKKMFTLVTTFAIIALPTLAYADILIMNNTNSSATAYTRFSPCSSGAGDRGIVKPHSSLSVPQYIISLWCGESTCDVHVFMSKNCTGKKVATITIDATKGITAVTNYDKGNYVISGDGNTLIADPAPKGFLKNWFND